MPLFFQASVREMLATLPASEEAELMELIGQAAAGDQWARQEDDPAT